MNGIIVTARGQFREAAQSWWVGVYAVAFAALALGLAVAGARGAGALGFMGFNRTSASLLNACLLLVPLVALALGASAISGERERGTLQATLAQPVARWEVLAGTFLGLLAALALATALGFGMAGFVIALLAPVIDPGRYLTLLLLVVALAGVMLAIGLWLSVVCGSRMRALGAALAVWFVLVLFFDLGVIGVTLSGVLGGRGLAAALLLNPVDVARVLAILRLSPDLEVLGPAGAYLADTLGTRGTAVVLVLTLALWLALPAAGVVWAFRRQDI
jgi:Cu-processing system permease protein